MTIDEAIRKIQSREITSRGNDRKVLSELTALLNDCKNKEQQLALSVSSSRIEKNNEEAAVSELKDELYGVESENTKYRRSIESLVKYNDTLVDLVLSLARPLEALKGSVSVSKSLFRNYDVNDELVVKAFGLIPDLSTIPESIKEKFKQKNNMQIKNKDNETVAIG